MSSSCTHSKQIQATMQQVGEQVHKRELVDLKKTTTLKHIVSQPQLTHFLKVTAQSADTSYPQSSSSSRQRSKQQRRPPPRTHFRAPVDQMTSKEGRHLDPPRTPSSCLTAATKCPAKRASAPHFRRSALLPQDRNGGTAKASTSKLTVLTKI